MPIAPPIAPTHADQTNRRNERHAELPTELRTAAHELDAGLYTVADIPGKLREAADAVEHLHRFKNHTHRLLDELRVPKYLAHDGCRIQQRLEHLAVYGLPGAVWVHVTNIRRALIVGMLLGTVVGAIGTSAIRYYLY